MYSTRNLRDNSLCYYLTNIMKFCPDQIPISYFILQSIPVIKFSFNSIAVLVDKMLNIMQFKGKFS